MAENVNDPLARRLAEVEQQGRAEQGDHWDAAIRGLNQQMTRSDPKHQTGSDPLTTADILAKTARVDAAGRLFADGISNADEKDWRAWRDSLPDRQRWRERNR